MQPFWVRIYSRVCLNLSFPLPGFLNIAGLKIIVKEGGAIFYGFNIRVIAKKVIVSFEFTTATCVA